jgi:membrane protease YdiL (CAAX protease family)
MTSANSRSRLSVIDEFRNAITAVAAPQNEPPKVVWRRRIVVAITLALGAAVLGLAIRQESGGPTFYWLTLALAAVWFAGSVASGPLTLGGIGWRGRNRLPIITGITVGLLLGGIFILGGLFVKEIPVVEDLIIRVLRFAQNGPSLLLIVVLVCNTIAEEMFFRGALYTVLRRRHPVTVSTAVYVVAILAGGNLMLGFAALVLGAVCAFGRRVTGGVLAPALTHLAWGLVMLLVLPGVFGL